MPQFERVVKPGPDGILAVPLPSSLRPGPVRISASIDPSHSRPHPLFAEHQTVSIRRAHPDQGVGIGDRGTVVHIYRDHVAYEVEFSRSGAQPVVLTLTADELEEHPVESSPVGSKLARLKKLHAEIERSEKELGQLKARFDRLKSAL